MQVVGGFDSLILRRVEAKLLFSETTLSGDVSCLAVCFSFQIATQFARTRAQLQNFKEILGGGMMERKSLSVSGKLESEIHSDEVGGQDGNARVLKTRGSNP